MNNKLGALLGRDADAAPIIKDLLSDYHAQVIAPPDASRGATFSQSGVIGLFSMIDYLQPSAEEINDLAVSDSMKGHIHAAVASAKVAVPQALKELDLPQMDASTLKDYIPRFISTMMDQLHPPIQKT